MSQPQLNFYKYRFWTFVLFALVVLFIIGAVKNALIYLGALS